MLLDGALVEHHGLEPVWADRIVVTESDLRGVAIDADQVPGLRLSDVVLRACDLSNVDGREGWLRRVEIEGSCLVGFGLTGGTVQDLRVVDSSLALASLAFSKLRDVVFERAHLAEASFMEAELESVTFIDCKFAGPDFRGVKLKGCAIRGTSLDGILGVYSLPGVAMRCARLSCSARGRPRHHRRTELSQRRRSLGLRAAAPGSGRLRSDRLADIRGCPRPRPAGERLRLPSRGGSESGGP